MNGNAHPGEEARVGACVRCRFGRPQASPRTGHRFWRCGRSDTEPEYPRYPRLPVMRCGGFARSEGAGNPV